MRSEGHAGLTLLILSAAALVVNYPLSESLLLILLTVLFSSLPDLDLRARYLIGHRGPLTHSVLAGGGFGLAFGFLFGYFGFGFLTGFVCAFLGTGLHLVGDLMTFTKIQPLWPFSERKIALGLFRSSNPIVNWGVATGGVFVFAVYVLSNARSLYL